MSATAPKLRFPGFAGAWPSQPLGNFIDEYRDKSITQDQHEVLTSARSGIVRQRDYFESDRLSERDNVGFNIIPPGYITYRSRSDDRRFYFNRNDLGITGIISIFYPVFRLIECDPKFFTALLDRYVDEIGKYSVGTSQTVLSLNQLRKISLPLPSLVEQTKIGSILGTVDAKLDALRRKKSGLEAFKSGLMQRLFSQELRFTREDGTEFPEWEEKMFGELVDWQSTNSLSREFLTDDPGDFQNIHYGDIHGKFPALFRQSVAAAPYITSTAPIRAPKDADFCRPGDVIFADASEDYADIGKTIEIIEVDERSLLAGLHTHLARPKEGCLAIGFPGYLMRTEAVRHQVMRFAQGISVLGISKDNLAKVRVQVPHLDEQRKIADALSAMHAKIAAVANQITHMETFKKGLLQQMFV